MSNSPELSSIVIPQYTPTRVRPTMGDAEYWSYVYGECELRSRSGDPLENRTWNVRARLMEWELQEDWPDSFFIEVTGNIVRHGITPQACMSDSSYPYHIQMGFLNRYQRRRFARLLKRRDGKWTLRVSKWAPNGHYQTGYRVVGGTIFQFLGSVTRELSISPPLGEYHISF